MGRLLHHKVKAPDLGKALGYISGVWESIGSYLPAEIPDPGRAFGLAGVGLALLGLFILTPLLEPLAAIFGYLAYRSGERLLGRIGMVTGVVMTVIFLLLYFLIFGAPEQR